MVQKFDLKFKKLGIEGEEKAVKILKSFGFILSRPDFRVYREVEYIFCNERIMAYEDIDIEVKAKAEPFKSPPFDGHGLDIYQKEKRLRIYKKYKIKQFLLVIQNDGKVYGQWLHKLEENKDNYFDTRNGIRIYSIDSFIEMEINLKEKLEN